MKNVIILASVIGSLAASAQAAVNSVTFAVIPPTSVVVPEPSTIALIGIAGLAALAFLRSRRK